MKSARLDVVTSGAGGKMSGKTHLQDTRMPAKEQVHPLNGPLGAITSVFSALGENPTPHALALIMALWQYADRDGIAYPSLHRLMRDCGMSRNTVRHAISQLVGAGIVQVVERGGPAPGGNRATVYKITEPYRLVGNGNAHSIGSSNGVGHEMTHPGSRDDPPWVTTYPPTYTIQHTPGGGIPYNRESTRHRTTKDQPKHPDQSKQRSLSRNLPQYDPIDVELTEALHGIVRAKQGDNWKLPSKIEKDYHACYLLRTQGNEELTSGVGEERIRAVIQWLATPDNWWIRTGNIRSMQKFRDKFVTLESQMQHEQSAKQSNVGRCKAKHELLPKELSPDDRAFSGMT